MELEGLNLDGILQNIMQDPKLLQSAMALAKGLSGSVGEQSFEEKPTEEKTAAKELIPREKEVSGGQKHNLHRQRKLLEALCLYVDERKRGKLEIILRLLDLVEFAKQTGL